jgi:hypothetical protein
MRGFSRAAQSLNRRGLYSPLRYGFSPRGERTSAAKSRASHAMSTARLKPCPSFRVFPQPVKPDIFSYSQPLTARLSRNLGEFQGQDEVTTIGQFQGQDLDPKLPQDLDPFTVIPD